MSSASIAQVRPITSRVLSVSLASAAKRDARQRDIDCAAIISAALDGLESEALDSNQRAACGIDGAYSSIANAAGISITRFDMMAERAAYIRELLDHIRASLTLSAR